MTGADERNQQAPAVRAAGLIPAATTRAWLALPRAGKQTKPSVQHRVRHLTKVNVTESPARFAGLTSAPVQVEAKQVLRAVLAAGNRRRCSDPQPGLRRGRRRREVRKNRISAPSRPTRTG